jgi:hypothetical protein
MLLFSRNAAYRVDRIYKLRDVLVRRAQSWINQAASEKRDERGLLLVSVICAGDHNSSIMSGHEGRRNAIRCDDNGHDSRQRHPE